MKKMIIYTVILILGVATVLGGYTLREMGRAPSAGELAAFEKLPYFKNGEFRTPEAVAQPLSGDYEDKMNFTKLLFSSVHAPATPLPSISLDRDSFSETPEDNIVYWLGHASTILELENKRFGIDLVFGNASPVPFTVRRYQPAPLKREELPKLDYVLLTHNHYDHLERKTVQNIKDARFIVPYGLKTTLTGWGISPDRITEIGWDETFEDGNIKITAVKGIHFSGRGLNDKNQTLWNSYIIKTPHHNIFWGGDSGYGKHYAEFGQKYGPFDWAALEIDAWNGGWPGIHMTPEQSAKAAVDLKAKLVLPIHWGVYSLGFHPWDKSIKRFVSAARGKPFGLLTPLMGEKLFPGATSTTLWWENIPNKEAD